MLSQINMDKLAGWQNAAGQLAPPLMGESGAEWTGPRENYLDAFEELFPVPTDVTYRNDELDGVPCIVAEPKEKIGGRTLFYIHGGGYCTGGARGYKGLAGHYANLLNATVYVPDYRLAPEFPYPTPINDTFRAYSALFARGVKPSELTISGDSAGGAMVVTIMRKARDAGVPLPAAGVAMSPWADLTHSSDAHFVRDGLDPLCAREFLMLLAKHFLGNTLPTDPDASPVYADVRGLAPILIQVGENEVMLDDGMRLAAHLGRNRVRISMEVWPGMFHVFQLFAGTLPEADAALSNAARFMIQSMENAAATAQPTSAAAE